MARQRYNPRTGDFEDDDQVMDLEDERISDAGGGGISGDQRYRDITYDLTPVPPPSRSTADYLRSQGVAENVIKDEAGYLDEHYGGGARQAAESSLGSYLQRSKSGGPRNEGGYSTDEPDPAIGGAPARTESALARPIAAPSSPTLQAAYSGYLGTPSAQSTQAAAQTAQAGEMTGLVKQLIDQANADRLRQDEERKAMREILTGRLKTAQEPVSTQTPGIRDVIAARRLESQRAAERQRNVLAERMAAQNLGDSGPMDAGIMGIEQARGEADASAVGDILGQELQSKRQEIQYLLQLAVQSGDAESARALQAQLAALEAQLQQEQLAGVDRRFGADLGFRKSSFLDDLGYRLLALQLGANQNAFNAFGGRA